MSLSRVLLACVAFAFVRSALSATPSGPIDPERLSATVRTLASEEFQGRAPGTAGETKTIAYLTDAFRKLGLAPGGENGGWTQIVPIVRTQINTPRTLNVSVAGKPRELVRGRDIYVSTIRKVDRVAIQNASMVFVGYGVTAPERQWDDYKGADLRGKVAVFLVNDPDFSAQPDEPVAGKFGGRRMTYYGRWT
jgi:hypothetical protein